LRFWVRGGENVKVAITGGAGYVGSALVPALVKRGYEVTVLDTCWFNEKPFLSIIDNSNLKILRGDIRNKDDCFSAFKDQDAVIHLACISNDPSFELDPTLGKAINYDAFDNVLEMVRECNVRRFIYASSSSVYGVKKEAKVTEDMSCEPLTDYSKFKLMCEEKLKNTDTKEMVWTIVRPATICGYAPRLRLDLSVNILTIQALVRNQITVFGGKQLRPNLNIQDMVRAYVHLLCARSTDIHKETFNIGFQNRSIMHLALLVKDHVPSAAIEVEESNDLRSYKVNSDKITKYIGFVPAYSIDEAIKSIIDRYTKGFIMNPFEDSRYYNLKKLKEILSEGPL
jgi:nucleoside-diphosphate-sugar epimerase